MMDPKTPLSKIMTTDVKTLSTSDTLDQAAELLDRHGIHHIPVIDASGRIQGILSKSDMRRVSYGFSLFKNPNRDAHDMALYHSLLVRDVMEVEPECLSPADTLADAVNLFKKNMFHAIPIIEGDQLVGIVTTYDLLDCALR